MEAVKGLTGKWHATEGKWDPTGNKLVTLCKKSISPNYRRMNTTPVNCGQCLQVIRGLKDSSR